MPLIAIWAESQNGIIGNGDQLPWHIPSELKHFKRLTTGHSVVMGYRTALGLKNKTFANRNMILYSNHSVDSSFKNFTVMDFNAILNLAKTEDVFVAGGAATYKDFLPFVDAVIRTVILKDYEGDVLAPDFHITDEMTVERIPVQNDDEPAYVVEYIALPLRKEITMDIGSGSGYPSSNLSNFSPHGFVVDGVECASMEGFLQSLKFQDPEMQNTSALLSEKQPNSKAKRKNGGKLKPSTGKEKLSHAIQSVTKNC